MDPQKILSFWLGELDADGLSAPDVAQRWWQRSESFDRLIEREFGSILSEIAAGGHRDWLLTPQGRLACVIVLDQFSRNIFRGSPRAFAHDELALALAQEGVELEQDRALRGQERVFLYMPYMHSERLDVQEQCVQLFERFRDESAGRLREQVEGNLQFAIRHRDIVATWGRFPHRNQILGRASTADELEFLNRPGSSF